MLDRLGNPQNRIPPAIHVAGTNGKGSTIAFMRSVLEAADAQVHVHTSPHLVSWRERYRLAGELVSDDILADAIERVSLVNEGKQITIFEIMSAVMFVLFSEHSADYSLVEVGLGGRADATNMIVHPLATAISPIAMDHQAYLGDTLGKIAYEKAGIIKRGSPLAVGVQNDEARIVIEDVANKLDVEAFFAGQDFDCYRDATGFVYQDEAGLLDLPLPALLGEHQLKNAGLAIATLRASAISIPDRAWKNGMASVTWPGRLQKLRGGKVHSMFGGDVDIWVDGGHNPAAGVVVADTLIEKFGAKDRNVIMICGMINTKEPVGYFEAFAGIKPELVTVPVAGSDAGIEPEALKSIAEKIGLSCTSASTLEDGISLAADMVKQPDQDPLVLFCGSLYMVGELLALNGTPPQ